MSDELVSAGAVYDQLAAMAKDQGRVHASYYVGLREAGVPAAVSREMALEWLRKELWPCGCPVDQGYAE